MDDGAWVFALALSLLCVAYTVFAVVRFARDVMVKSLAALHRAETMLMSFHNVSVDYYRHTRDVARAEAEARNAPRGPAPSPAAPPENTTELPLTFTMPSHGQPTT